MIRRPVTIEFWRGDLPHWEVEDGRYFITIHQKDAIPLEGMLRLRELGQQVRDLPIAALDERLRQQRAIFREMEKWLDVCRPRHNLTVPEIGEILTEAIDFREGKQWHVFEHVIMPSHVHLFLAFINSRMKETLENFKRWTATRTNRVLGTIGQAFWQTEWFDHWSRSDEQDERICRYIRQNPVQAGLISDYTAWRYGSWSAPSTKARRT